MLTVLFLFAASLLIIDVSTAPNLQIVNGFAARQCEFPSVVHLLITDQSAEGENSSRCAATIIDSTHLLTAAHCLEDGDPSIKISIGSVGEEETEVESLNTTSFIVHENYTRTNTFIFNDIAIIILQQPINFTKCVKAAKIAKKSATFDNKTCETIGWGRTKSNGLASKILLKTKLTSISFETCLNKSQLIILPGFICAGDFKPGGAHTCYGDSGGPLYCPDANGVMIFAGITSFGVDCYSDINVFSSIAFHSDWIMEHIN
ncbi:transmembrane protease serine 11C [Octopus bimaculoides]|uniref:Peptidase S1 domain-containing protein n=1 Tax=Octopus bimaculoides TaxID=37653 RepID=A0A0L8HY03_OCTBM|nr:transmembrane protease serine 11C [Octopus bimaculoides]|eukprot:XP_014768494.1 PREDICTED: chymotrypsin-like elastase family member 2A [Octopus bimaculoides]